MGPLRRWQLIQGAVAGGTAAWAAATIGRREGSAAGLATFAALFVFASQFTMAALTENAGLLLGSLAVILLWRRGPALGAWDAFAIMALLGLGMNARAGAVLVLPALVGWCLIGGDGVVRERLARVLAALAGLAAAFAVNGWMVGELGGIALSAHSNAAYNAYAMAVGGDRWPRILADYPELAGMPPEEFAPIAYRLAWEKFLEQPWLLAWAYAKGAAHWLYELFRFVDWPPLRAMLVGLWLGGLAYCWSNRQDGRVRILATMLAGVAASAPFLTWFGGNRVFAVTYPVDAVLVGLGARWVAERFGRVAASARPARPAATLPAAGLGIGLLAVLAIPAAKAWPLLTPIDHDPACAAGETALVAEYGRETPSIKLVEVGGLTGIWPPRFKAEDFHPRLDRWLSDLDKLRQVSPGTEIVQAMQRLPSGYGQPLRFFWNGEPPPPGMVAACLPAGDGGGWLVNARTMTAVRP